VEHGTDWDVLGGLTVAAAFDSAPEVVSEDASVDLLLAHLGRGAYNDLPVVDDERTVAGSSSGSHPVFPERAPTA
jgi:hypothetical protein